MEKVFHKDCFVCTGCNGSIQSGYGIIDGQPNCKFVQNSKRQKNYAVIVASNCLVLVLLSRGKFTTKIVLNPQNKNKKLEMGARSIVW